MKSRLRPQGKLFADINMVPFTDLVLVLLVIFMVTTPFLFQGSFQVKLPKVAAPSPTLPSTIDLTIAQGDHIYLNDKEVTMDLLTGAIKDAVARNPTAVVMINADKEVTHGTVVDVMSHAYQAGVTQMGIGVDVSQTPVTAAVP